MPTAADIIVRLRTEGFDSAAREFNKVFGGHGGAGGAPSGSGITARHGASLAQHFIELGKSGEMSMSNIARETLLLENVMSAAGVSGAAAFGAVAAAAVATGLVIKKLTDYSKEADAAWTGAGVKAQGFVANMAIGLGLINAPGISGEFDQAGFDKRVGAQRSGENMRILRQLAHPDTAEERAAKRLATEGAGKMSTSERTALAAKIFAEETAKDDSKKSAERAKKLSDEAWMQNNEISNKAARGAKLAKLTGEENVDSIMWKALGVAGGLKKLTGTEDYGLAREVISDKFEKDKRLNKMMADSFSQDPKFASSDEVGSVGAYKAQIAQESGWQQSLQATLQMLLQKLQGHSQLTVVSLDGGN